MNQNHKMNLQLFLKGKLIASLPIDDSCMSDPLYISTLKKELEEQHKDLIEEPNSKHTFCIESKSLMSSRRRKGSIL